MKKKWNNDDNNENPNYYSTRTDSFRVTLQRTTTENPQSDSDWTTVYSNVELQTNKNSRDTYDDYSSDSHFRNLPKYDSNGNKYYYRVIETYIGPEQDNYKTDKTYSVYLLFLLQIPFFLILVNGIFPQVFSMPYRYVQHQGARAE